MTAAFTTLLPMLAACFAAMLTANLLKAAPIYDSLRERILASAGGGRTATDPTASLPSSSRRAGEG
jgi:H+/Cl- antiporter ClcA